MSDTKAILAKLDEMRAWNLEQSNTAQTAATIANLIDALRIALEALRSIRAASRECDEAVEDIAEKLE
jgi:hypothetical protein